MNKNKLKINIFVSLLIIVIIIIGTSFAYFIFRIDQENSNQINTVSCLELQYGNMDGNLELNNMYPITDDEATTKTTPYEFNIENTCTTNSINVYILLSSESKTDSSKINDDYMKINLNNTTTNASETFKLLEKSYHTGTEKLGDAEGYNLKSVTIPAATTYDYSLRMWIDDKTTKDDLGWNESNGTFSKTTWSGKITIVGVPKDTKI